MGGPSAPDDLRLGHLTQEWLATRDLLARLGPRHRHCGRRVTAMELQDFLAQSTAGSSSRAAPNSTGS